MKIWSGPANASSRFVVQRWLPCAAASSAMPLGVAADQHQLGDQPVAVRELQPALRGDGQQIGHVLGRAHAARGAVDDDADSTIAHVCLLQQLLPSF